MGKRKQKTKKPRKGFFRSMKEWDESIAGHIGHLIDNSSLKDVSELIAMATVAYYGYKVGELGGAATATIGLKLALVPNSLLSNGAGLAVLAGIGLLNVRGHLSQEQAMDNLRKRGYSEEEIAQMMNFGLQVQQDFHPFG